MPVLTETEAVSAALKSELPKRHPSLIEAVVEVKRIGGSGAYEITLPSGAHLIAKTLAAPLPDEGADAYAQWLAMFGKAIWIHGHVNPAVPVPQLLPGGTGRITVRDIVDMPGDQDYLYMLQERLPYDPSPVRKGMRWNRGTGIMSVGPEFSDDDAGLHLLEQIGEMARCIHATPTPGYGGGWYSRHVEFDTDAQRFGFTTWDEMVDHLVQMAALDRFAASTGLSQPQIKALEQRFAALKGMNTEPHLFHGDLTCNLSNLLVDPATGAIKGVVDWDSSGSGPAAHFDFAMSRRWWFRDGWTDDWIERNFDALLRGYGLTRREYAANYQYEVDTITLLMALHLVDIAPMLQSHWGWQDLRPTMMRLIGLIMGTLEG